MPSSRLWLGMLLGGSLAFNAMFLAGRYRAQKRLERSEDPNAISQVVRQQLQFSAEQWEAFNTLKEQARNTEASLAALDHSLATKLWKQLDQGTLSTEELDSIVHSMADHVQELNRTNAIMLLDFLKDLSPPQRQQLLGILKERRLFKHLGTGDETVETP